MSRARRARLPQATLSYVEAPNRMLSAANGIDFAYREVGEGTPAKKRPKAKRAKKKS